MKRRLLAFLLAFVMTFSLVPVNTFAAEADAAALYTNITTESGENVTVEYVETVVGEAAWGQSINTPYYHVTIPEGTEKVLLTYPESVNLVLSGDDGAVFFYRNTYPGQSEIALGGALTVATNNDGSKTVTIPVENFMLSTDGSVAVGMAYYVDEENQSAAEFFDFTYAAPTHAVTLTPGDGYTLTGEATVEDGKDYSFTVTIADDYEMEDNFVVKANGETLTAGESGSYTVENVTADLTITVEGVVKKQAAGHAVTLTPGEGYTLTGEATAEDGKDYTFTANDVSKKYDFTGSTMGGKDVEVTDNGDGTYTVKNVSGELIIKATEKVSKVTINLSGDAVDTITQKSWDPATEVDAGTALWFMARPEPGKELVVTVNDEVVAGRNMQAFMRYDIAADKVTGTELNIVVSYKAADKATIIESGTAWDKVGSLSRKGWTQSGDKVDAGATLDFFFKPETGKTIDDYVIRANDVNCTYAKVGGRYKVTIPAEIITAGATVTINFDYAATPEPTITVNVSEYLKLDGQSIFLITATGEVADGKVLAYDKNPMYWSSKYGESGAYAWLVISDKGLEEVKAAAKAAITAVDGAKVEIAYTGDVNLTNAADINDAQLVWNMYNAEYSDFQKVNVRKFLEADMIADGKLDTADAAAIIALITK